MKQHSSKCVAITAANRQGRASVCCSNSVSALDVSRKTFGRLSDLIDQEYFSSNSACSGLVAGLRLQIAIFKFAPRPCWET
jgi:hypothetical protein